MTVLCRFFDNNFALMIRNDTIDSKILNKYGVFVHRNNPDLVYIKSNKKALESFNEDFNKMTDLSNMVQSKKIAYIFSCVASM